MKALIEWSLPQPVQAYPIGQLSTAVSDRREGVTRTQNAMFVPCGVGVAVELDLAAARRGFDVVDDLTANRAQVARFRPDGNALAFALW